ncbi:MAG TPA: lipid-binding SYLF domain-containing protein [Pyrinomonadaceae bacterium]|jgi:lipid-binding SYLF domain-containing protein|nr:lipid-binding SYLF domain-containing protein [Pyrinomonadaceae bacterium]
MILFERLARVTLATFAAACLICAGASAQKKSSVTVGKRADDASRHSREAAEVLRKVMSVPEKEIPRDLLESAEAVAVCPGVLKAAFIVGGRKGDCVISRRTLKRQWGSPVFYNLAGGSIGLQAGGAKTDYVLLFMNSDALKGLMGDKFEIGGEAEATAGPVGRAAGASTNARLTAGIITYSRSKGLFGGLSLKGVAITPDNDLNEAFYGKKASELIESRADASPPTQVRAFPLALARYSVRLPN